MKYDVKEYAKRVFYSVNQIFKDCNSFDASPYTYPCISVGVFWGVSSVLLSVGFHLPVLVPNAVEPEWKLK